MRWPLYALGLLLVVASAARADEIRLKDGSKITGTIVDFQDDAFKVQTVYGFAMVRKDSIAQIIPSEPAKAAAATTPAIAPAPATAKPVAVSSPAVTPAAQPAVSKGPTAVSTSTTVLPMPAPRPRAAAPTPVATVAAAPTSAPSAAAVAAPAVPPAVMPGPIRESVQGTVYRNETFNFQLYRPPGWELLPEARKALPNAIAAMGTGDTTTLFVIGREPVKDSLDAQAGNAQKGLQKVYENYRQVSSSKRMVNGLPAVEWKFRGMADGHDWSVTALTIAHGQDVFTLLGMTYAESDLIQIRENVIAKMLASVQFNAQQ